MAQNFAQEIEDHVSCKHKINLVVGSVQATVIIQDRNYRTEVLRPEPARASSFKIAIKEGNDLFLGDILEFFTNQNYAVWERKHVVQNNTKSTE